MKNYTYDGSFEGLLSCVFTIYSTKISPASISIHELNQFSLLDECCQVPTHTEQAERVIKAVNAYSNERGGELLYRLFLSELPQIEITVYRLVKIIMSARDASVLSNFAEPVVLQAAQIDRMIGREVHRMHAFVRFQKTQAGLFYAAIEPDFNVLPLLGAHFKNRYADQRWVIMDQKRGYGLTYDLENCEFVAASEFQAEHQTAPEMDEQELSFQKLWGVYFHSVNIKERNNPRLHLRHMPRRYWKGLTEKQLNFTK